MKDRFVIKEIDPYWGTSRYSFDNELEAIAKFDELVEKSKSKYFDIKIYLFDLEAETTLEDYNGLINELDIREIDFERCEAHITFFDELSYEEAKTVQKQLELLGLKVSYWPPKTAYNNHSLFVTWDHLK